MKAATFAPSAVPQEIPLSLLVESATNPRQHFDESGLNELAETIRKSGVLHEAATAYKVDTESITKKMRQEFEARSKVLGKFTVGVLYIRDKSETSR